MLINVQNDKRFQSYLDAQEQRLHNRLFPILNAGIRLHLSKGAIHGHNYIIKRGEPVLAAHYKRVYRDVYTNTFHEQKQARTGVGDFLAEQVGYLSRRAANLIANIAQSLMNTIRNIIVDGVNQGWSNQKITKQITEDAPTISRNRAAVIARTETHSSATAAMEDTIEYQGIDVKKKQWWSVGDQRVRPSHQDMHGEVANYGDVFSNGLRFPGDPDGEPEEVINCLTGDIAIGSCDILAAMRHFYCGKFVEIRTTRSSLKATPNHPIATPRGWIAAGCLHIGDDILYVPSVQFLNSSIDVNGQERPATLKQIFDTFAASGLVNRMRPALFNFHGDRPTSDVEIIFPYRELLDDVDISSPQSISDNLLIGTDEITSIDASSGASLQFGIASAASASSNISGQGIQPTLPGRAFSGEKTITADAVGGLQSEFRDNPPHCATFQTEVFGDTGFGQAVGMGGTNGFEIRHEFEPESITTCPHDSSGADIFVDSHNRDAGSGIDFCERFPGVVERDQVLDVTVRQFDGHVYNLETADGFYIANGCLVQNCRCTCLYFSEESAGYSELP